MPHLAPLLMNKIPNVRHNGGSGKTKQALQMTDCCSGFHQTLHILHSGEHLLTYVVWQKSNETEFLLTMNLWFLQIKIIPFRIVPLGSYTATEALFPFFVAVLEGFCWYTFQLVGYALLDIIQNKKWRPFKWFVSRGNKKKSQGLRSGEQGAEEPQECFFLPKIH